MEMAIEMESACLHALMPVCDDGCISRCVYPPGTLLAHRHSAIPLTLCFPISIHKFLNLLTLLLPQ